MLTDGSEAEVGAVPPRGTCMWNFALLNCSNWNHFVMLKHWNLLEKKEMNMIWITGDGSSCSRLSRAFSPDSELTQSLHNITFHPLQWTAATKMDTPQRLVEEKHHNDFKEVKTLVVVYHFPFFLVFGTISRSSSTMQGPDSPKDSPDFCGR